MNIIVLHVLAGMCGFGEQYKARIGKFSTDLTAAHPDQIRMAGKPENFASTGFFLCVSSGRVSRFAEVGGTHNRSSNVRALTQPPSDRINRLSPGNTGNAQKFCHVKTSTRRYQVPQTTDNETAGAADRPSDSPHKARRLIKEYRADTRVESYRLKFSRTYLLLKRG